MIGLFGKIALELSIVGFLASLISIIIVLKTKRKRSSIIVLLCLDVIVYLGIFGTCYFVLPSLSVSTIFFYNLCVSILYIVVNAGILYITPENYYERNKHHHNDDDYILDYGNDAGMNFIINGGLSIFVILFVGVIIYGSISLSQTKSTATQIPMEQVKNTNSAPMPEITNETHDSELPVVNSNETVETQIENSVSNLKNANVYDVDHVRAQLYHGNMVYIAPLDFTSGYWKYRHYGKIDGYFMVDATTKNATPHFVKTNMYYTPNAYFNKDANRRIYANVAAEGYIVMNHSSQLEIDESGHPYYVSSIMKKRFLSSKYDYRSKGVVTLNAKTGKVKVYRNLKDKPKWLDVAVSPEIASKQIETWGHDRNGFINTSTFGSEMGVLNPDENVGTEGNNDELTPIKYRNHIYYFATMTSANSKQTSAFGYTYTDAATGKSYYYRETDEAMTPGRAKTLANDQMRQTQWSASMPLLYRIDGKPTWIVSMLDSSDAFRSYVYLLASGNGTSNTVATGTDATSTLHAYRNLSNVTTASSSSKAKTTHVQGTVSRVNVKNNQINFILTEQPNIIYSINFNDVMQAQFINPGDKVQFNAKIVQHTGSYTSGFKNSTIIK